MTEIAFVAAITFFRFRNRSLFVWGGHGVSTEKMDLDAILFQHSAMMPPIGVGGIENRRRFRMSQGNSDILSIRTVKGAQSWLTGKFDKVGGVG